MGNKGFDDLDSYATNRQRQLNENARERVEGLIRPGQGVNPNFGVNPGALGDFNLPASNIPSDLDLAKTFVDAAIAKESSKKPQFWTNTKLAFDPKSQFRWRVRIPGFSGIRVGTGNDHAGLEVDDSVQLGIWYAKTIDKPSYAVKNLVEGRYPVDGVLAFPKITATSPELKPITMTLVDPVNPDATRVLAKYLRNGGFQEKTKPDNSTQGYLSTNYPLSNERTQSDFTVGEMYIEQLDSRGNVLERWTLIDPYPIDVNFGKLDYSSDDLVEISVTWGYRTFKVFFAATGNSEEIEYFAEIPAANSLGGGSAGGLPGT